MAELLDRYGLSLNELDLRRQSCEGVGIETGRKRRGPIDDCMTTIARFFDCRVWAETTAGGTLRYIFFGLPADVQAAVYLHDLIVLAFETDYPNDFLDLVMELRETRASEFTLRDTPIFTCIKRPSASDSTVVAAPSTCR